MRINSTELSCINWICDAVKQAARRQSICFGGAVLKKNPKTIFAGATFVCVGPQRQGVSLCSDLGGLCFRRAWPNVWLEDAACGLTHAPLCFSARSLRKWWRVREQSSHGSWMWVTFNANATMKVQCLPFPLYFQWDLLWYSSIFDWSGVLHRFGRKYKSEERLLQAFRKNTEKEEATTSCKQCLLLKRLAWMPH